MRPAFGAEPHPPAAPGSGLRRLALGLLACLAVATHPAGAAAQVLQQNMWVTDGDVNAVAFRDSVLYIGGSFTRVGPPIGAAATFDPSSGNMLQPWLQVVGTVSTVISDGGGGWYFGGTFTHVQGQRRHSVAHVDASGHLTAWNPDIEWTAGNTPIVNSLALSGATLYIGGDFYTINGLSRAFLAAVDTVSGAPTGWDPAPDDVVQAVAPHGNTVYVAGSFSLFAGVTGRQGLAAIDATTGVPTSWNPGYSYGIEKLAISALSSFPFTVTVWAVGGFNTLAGQPRNYLGAVDGSSGAATSWAPNANAAVHAITLRLGALGAVSSVYVGGDFTNIGGQTRNYIAQIDGSGAAMSWNPGANASVNALAISGPIVAGGTFTSIGGQPRNYLATLDATSGAATSWNPNANHAATAVGYNGSQIFAGGTFTSLGGVARSNIAALSIGDGTPMPWAPYVSGPIYAMLASGNTVYVGGDFFNVGGVLHAHIAAIDSTSGLPTSWDPTTDNPVFAMALHGNSLYVGGGFDNVSGATRFGLGAIDLTTGGATSWNPGVTVSSCETCPGTVYALGISAQDAFPFTVTVWAGGNFQWTGYYPNLTQRNYLAAFDGSTGALTSWNPGADGLVYALSLRPGLLIGSVKSVFAGGNFLSIGGQARSHLAEIGSNGSPTSWVANTDFTVDAVSYGGGAVYAGGEFSLVGGQSRNGLAALDATTGAPSAWDAGLERHPFSLVQVNAIAVRNGLVYAGGHFDGVLGSSHASLGVVSQALAGAGVEPQAPPLSPGVLQAVPNPFRAGVSVRFALAHGQRVEAAIYDPAGRRVRTLHQGWLAAGPQRFEWDGRTDAGHAASAGIYFVRVQGPGLRLEGKVLRIE